LAQNEIISRQPAKTTYNQAANRKSNLLLCFTISFTKISIQRTHIEECRNIIKTKLNSELHKLTNIQHLQVWKFRVLSFATQHSNVNRLRNNAPISPQHERGFVEIWSFCSRFPRRYWQHHLSRDLGGSPCFSMIAMPSTICASGVIRICSGSQSQPSSPLPLFFQG
jgi:hypothetical protein